MAAVDLRFVTPGLAKYEYSVTVDGSVVGIFRTDDLQNRDLVKSFANEHMNRLAKKNPERTYDLRVSESRQGKYLLGWGLPLGSVDTRNRLDFLLN